MILRGGEGAGAAAMAAALEEAWRAGSVVGVAGPGEEGRLAEALDNLGEVECTRSTRILLPDCRS